MLPVQWDAPGLFARADRACVDGSRGLRVPLAGVFPAAAVGICSPDGSWGLSVSGPLELLGLARRALRCLGK